MEERESARPVVSKILFEGWEHPPMASRPSSKVARPSEIGRMKLKAFLTAVMSLLSILVFVLGCMQQSVLWSWLGFSCALVSGIFVQLFINRKRSN
jgi:hypothetical protein